MWRQHYVAVTFRHTSSRGESFLRKPGAFCQRYQFAPRQVPPHWGQAAIRARKQPLFRDELRRPADGIGKAHLLHGSTVSDQAVSWLTFTCIQIYKPV